MEATSELCFGFTVVGFDFDDDTLMDRLYDEPTFSDAVCVGGPGHAMKISIPLFDHSTSEIVARFKALFPNTDVFSCETWTLATT